MSTVLNFNDITKRYLTITFTDEHKTTIMVGTPTKTLLRELINLTTKIDNTETEDSFGTLDALYDVCAKVMSRNKAGVKITKEFLEDNFDFEDILLFLNKYMSFISEITRQKN